jgi:acetylglutamate kinase
VSQALSEVYVMAIEAASAALKAQILAEALPYIQRFHDKAIVIKYGGNAMTETALKAGFARDVVMLKLVGMNPVIVHGGGPQISAELDRRGIASEFRGGLRVTSPAAFEVVREVLTTQVGPEIAALISSHGLLGEVLSGETGGLFEGVRRGTVLDGEYVDLGLVGDVARVNPAPVLEILDSGRIPVVSSIAPDSAVPGQSLNVNADSAAAALAIALDAAKLVILTDVAGLYRDWPDRESLITTIDSAELGALLPSLESGMIPKMTACLDAVNCGVPKAAIIDGRIPHSILLEAFTAEGIGTEVVTATEEA